MPFDVEKLVLSSYGKLKQQNPENDPKIWRKIRLLYKGGYSLKKAAREFIKKSPNETEESYQYRLERVSYICYFGQVIDYLVSALFEEKLLVTPAGDSSDPTTLGDLPDEEFWPEFARNADRDEKPFSHIVSQAMTTALLCKRGVICVDLPPRTSTPVNRAQEERSGAGRGYCWEETLEDLLDWRVGEDGKWQWAILWRRIIERANPWDDRSMYRDRFKVWFMENGVAQFVVLETKSHKIADKEPDEKEILTLVDQGSTSFKRIPIVVVELPEGLWAGNKIGPLAEEHFQRRSDLFGAIGRNLVEIPWYRQGSTVRGVGESLPSEPGEDEKRGDKTFDTLREKGIVPLGDQDEIGFAGPSGKAYEVASKGCDDLRDEIYRTVTAMAMSLPNTAATVGRSGTSKREDHAATESVLGALGDFARRGAREVYSCLAEARGENVKWTVEGCSKFHLMDRAGAVTEAVQVETIQLPSPTFWKEFKSNFALSLVPNSSPETRLQIQKELADGIEEKQAFDEALREAARRAALAGGGAPGVGGSKLPGNEGLNAGRNRPETGNAKPPAGPAR